MKFLQRANKVFQYFIFDDPKYPKAIRDSRYVIYDKFEKKIKELSLSTVYPETFSFIERVDADDKVVLSFSSIEENTFKNYYFTLAGFVSKSPGCITCFYNKNCSSVFIECSKKEKIIAKAVKSCVMFKEEERLFKT